MAQSMYTIKNILSTNLKLNQFSLQIIWYCSYPNLILLKARRYQMKKHFATSNQYIYAGIAVNFDKKTTDPMRLEIGRKKGTCNYYG